ncbi:hypothetical protein N7470_005959 [Penicillium chermesinum]|nr:hypothetical protein N7470_005959 [Penicillium chermesinum]
MGLLQVGESLAKRDHGGVYLSDRGAQGLAVSVIFTLLAAGFVGLRLFTRIHIMRKIESNDWMVVVALAFWLTVPFYNAAVLCAKASILLQYFRVFPTQRMRVVCWFMITVLAIYGTWAVLSAFLNCIPVAKFWDPSIDGFCLSKPGLWFSNASMHIATDLFILIIPIPALISIEIPRRHKAALIGVFALGGFVCVTSIIRLVSLKRIADSTDPTYDNVGAASWSAIECNTGIICACLPTLKPLVSRIMPGLLSTLDGSQRQHSAPMANTLHTWNDESMGGAPGEEPEYGAGDPERVLSLSPSGFRWGAKRWSKIDKTSGTGAPQITELTEQERRGHL